MAKKTMLLILVLALMFTSSSCWDQKPIENQAFIIGLALDKGKQPDKIMVTFQIAQPKAFIAESPADESFWNITEEADDISTAQSQLANIMNWIPSFMHCQVILIGEDLAREGLHKYHDFILRTHEVRRRLKVAVVQGKAKDILDMDFKSALLPAFVVAEMMSQNIKYSYDLTDYMDVAEIHRADSEGFDFVLGRIIPMDNKIEMSGSGVFKNLKLVGWLSGEETMGVRFLQGNVGSGYLTVDLPEEFGDRAVLRVYEAHSRLEPELKGNKLYVRLKVRLEGDIQEIVNEKGKMNETVFLSTAQRLFEADLKEKIEHAFRKAQQEYESEPFGIKDKVKSYYPKYWKQHKDQWEELYRSAKLEIEAKVLIRRIGEVNN